MNEYCSSASEDVRILAMDIKKAIANCGLSKEQALIVRLLSSGRYKQRDVAAMLHLSKPKINIEYKKACEKICIYLEKNC
jgi:predicted XRE-type DNA-binding protein